METQKHLNLSKTYPNLSKTYPFLSKSYPKTSRKFPCKYCGKEFKFQSGVSKHIKYVCKLNKDEDIKELVRLLNDQQEINKVKDDQIETMQKQIRRLSNKLQIQHIGTQNNNSHNRVVNYTINNYVDTDYSHLTHNDYIKCISDCNHCVKTLVEKVHMNRRVPENMNILISNLKDSFVMIFKNEQWLIEDRKEILDDLYDRNEYELETWYTEFKDTYPEIIKSFERYLKNKEEDTVVNDVKRKILMEFYNKRDLILKNKNQG